jgi:hypothetical protein
MRRLALVAAALLWLAVPIAAQEHTNRFELTEQFIRETWLYPLRAMNVTVLGEGPGQRIRVSDALREGGFLRLFSV